MQEPLRDNSQHWARVESSDIWLEVIAPHLYAEIEIATDDLCMIDSEDIGAADKRAVIQGRIMSLRSMLSAPRNQQLEEKFAAEMMARQEEEDAASPSRRRTAFRRPGR